MPSPAARLTESPLIRLLSAARSRLGRRVVFRVLVGPKTPRHMLLQNRRHLPGCHSALQHHGDDLRNSGVENLRIRRWRGRVVVRHGGSFRWGTRAGFPQPGRGFCGAPLPVSPCRIPELRPLHSCHWAKNHPFFTALESGALTGGAVSFSVLPSNRAASPAS